MLKNTNKVKGILGEELACSYLISQGYTILEKNYKRKNAEIDIIASFGNLIVFVEVKLRNSLTSGLPREAIGYTKQNKIKLTAEYYIYENKVINGDFRFDVIEILKGNINHIENAFW